MVSSTEKLDPPIRVNLARKVAAVWALLGKTTEHGGVGDEDLFKKVALCDKHGYGTAKKIYAALTPAEDAKLSKHGFLKLMGDPIEFPTASEWEQRGRSVEDILAKASLQNITIEPGEEEPDLSDNDDDWSKVLDAKDNRTTEKKTTSKDRAAQEGERAKDGREKNKKEKHDDQENKKKKDKKDNKEKKKVKKDDDDSKKGKEEEKKVKKPREQLDHYMRPVEFPRALLPSPKKLTFNDNDYCSVLLAGSSPPLPAVASAASSSASGSGSVRPEAAATAAAAAAAASAAAAAAAAAAATAAAAVVEYKNYIVKESKRAGCTDGAPAWLLRDVLKDGIDQEKIPKSVTFEQCRHIVRTWKVPGFDAD